MATNSVEQVGSRQFCSECGRAFDVNDLVRFGSAAVCAECKPVYVQRMREGAATSASVIYGGFWLRLAALLVDGVLLSIVVLPIRWGFMMLANPTGPEGFFPLYLRLFAFWSWGTPVAWLIELAYSVYFVSQKGATLGKMLLGLKVVTASGGKVSVARAFGRFFARYLSWLILGIGYIMAAFDDQKRTLHDHICNTRVVRE